MDKIVVNDTEFKHIEIENYPKWTVYLSRADDYEMKNLNGFLKELTPGISFVSYGSGAYFGFLSEDEPDYAELIDRAKKAVDDTLNNPPDFYILPTDDKSVICMMNRDTVWQFSLPEESVFDEDGEVPFSFSATLRALLLENIKKGEIVGFIFSEPLENK